MSSPEGKEITLSGWKKSGISDVIHLGSTGLPPLESFNDLCPLMEVKEALCLTLLFPEELDWSIGGNDENHNGKDHSEW